LTRQLIQKLSTRFSPEEYPQMEENDHVEDSNEKINGEVRKEEAEAENENVEEVKDARDGKDTEEQTIKDELPAEQPISSAAERTAPEEEFVVVPLPERDQSETQGMSAQLLLVSFSFEFLAYLVESS
jgi:hypothetical protein